MVSPRVKAARNVSGGRVGLVMVTVSATRDQRPAAATIEVAGLRVLVMCVIVVFGLGVGIVLCGVGTAWGGGL